MWAEAFPFLNSKNLLDKASDGPSKEIEGIEWEGREDLRKAAFSGSMREFSTALLDAEILDHKSVNLQGASIWFPYGMELRRSFDNVVGDTYRKSGIEEFHYPSLVPESIFSPLDGLYSLKNKTLLVGTEEEMQRNEPRGVMSPTGEATIYHHWSKYLRNRTLPFRMYRNATYFRPVSHQAGMGIFNAMEATGVYEFHAAYANREPIDSELNRYQQMLQGIFSHFRLPVVWSLRPSWTNNGAISVGTYGADTILPNETSLQIGALYDQDSIFSKRFGIFSNLSGSREPTKQIAGYCSRRVLTSQLMTACSAFGHLFIHPSFAPIQTAIIFHRKTTDQRIWNEFSEAVSTAKDVRLSVNVEESPKRLTQFVKKMSDKGVPLIAVIQDKRTENDQYCLILIRSDLKREAKVRFSSLNEFPIALIKSALTKISSDSDITFAKYFEDRVTEVDEIDDLKKKDFANLIVLPLSIDEQSVRQLESSINGEILGFIQAETLKKCAIRGDKVYSRAILCRRF